MKAFQLTREQIVKLKELVKAICPLYLLRATQYRSNQLLGKDTLTSKTFEWWYVSNGEINNIELIGWFEFCMTDLATFIIKQYAQANNQSESWSHRLVMQKLGHDLPKVNPIDTLYELWKNPETYVEGL